MAKIKEKKKVALSGREEEEGGMTLDCEEGGIKIVSLSCALGKMDI